MSFFVWPLPVVRNVRAPPSRGQHVESRGVAASGCVCVLMRVRAEAAVAIRPRILICVLFMLAYITMVAALTHLVVARFGLRRFAYNSATNWTKDPGSVGDIDIAEIFAGRQDSLLYYIYL